MPYLDFADGICILTKNHDTAIKEIETLNKRTEKVGLQKLYYLISIEKTQVFIKP